MSQFIEMFGTIDEPKVEVKKLIDVVLSSGQYGSNTSATDYQEGKPRYIRITDINDDGSLNDDIKTAEVIEDKYRLIPGDIVFARTGATVGKTYMHETGNAIYAGYLIKYQMNESKMKPAFMKAFTHSKTYYNWVANSQKVGAQPNISAAQYDNMPVLVPQIEKQEEFLAICHQADKSGFVGVKSQFIEMFGNPLSQVQRYPLEKLGDCCVLNPRRPSISLSDTDMVSFVPMPCVSENGYLQDVADEEYGKVKKGFTYFENKDVLFAKITPCMENGKGAIAQELTNGIGMGSTEFHVLRPIEGKSNSYWLLALTRMPIFREQASKNMSGTGGQKRVGASFLDNFMVGLPPVEEQNRFERIYRQADKSQFIEMFGCLAERVALSSLCDTFIDGDWIEAKDQSGSGIRLIQTGNVGVGTFKDKGDRARYISEETFNRLNCTEVVEGDILISRLPEPVGRACIIPAGLGKSITAVDCTIIRLNDKVLPKFFVAFTNTPDYAMQIKKVLSGTTRLRVSRANLGKIQVPLPSIDKQQQFVTIAEQADKSGFRTQQIH